jgi:drug/metabolite transporter (DMT)-like permease
MFWFLALISMFGYALQGTLMARYVRGGDPLSMSFYRNLSLGISLLPLLFLAGGEAIKTFFSSPAVWWILLAGFLGSVAQWTRFLSLRMFPVGIHTALSTGLNVVLSFLFAFLWFGEEIVNPWIYAFVALILLGGWGLIWYKKTMPHLDQTQIWWGAMYIVMTALFFTTSFILVVHGARTADPWVSGYVWEVSIGIFSGIFLWTRHQFLEKPLEKITLQKWSKILIVCSPTLIGTGAFALASTMGPVGIITAIGAGGIFVSTLLAHFLYREKLSLIQVFFLCLIFVGIVGFRWIGV